LEQIFNSFASNQISTTISQSITSLNLRYDFFWNSYLIRKQQNYFILVKVSHVGCISEDILKNFWNVLLKVFLKKKTLKLLHFDTLAIILIKLSKKKVQ